MMPEEEFETVEELAPFTLEDAKEENVCLLCEYRNNCPIIVYVNKLSVKRDGKAADADFGCSLFFELVEEEV